MVKRIPEMGATLLGSGPAIDGDTLWLARGEFSSVSIDHERNHGGPNAWGHVADLGPFAGCMCSITLDGDKAILTDGSSAATGWTFCRGTRGERTHGASWPASPLGPRDSPSAGAASAATRQCLAIFREAVRPRPRRWCTSRMWTRRYPRRARSVSARSVQQRRGWMPAGDVGVSGPRRLDRADGARDGQPGTSVASS